MPERGTSPRCRWFYAYSALGDADRYAAGPTPRVHDEIKTQSKTRIKEGNRSVGARAFHSATAEYCQYTLISLFLHAKEYFSKCQINGDVFTAVLCLSIIVAAARCYYHHTAQFRDYDIACAGVEERYRWRWFLQRLTARSISLDAIRTQSHAQLSFLLPLATRTVRPVKPARHCLISRRYTARRKDYDIPFLRFRDMPA